MEYISLSDNTLFSRMFSAGKDDKWESSRAVTSKLHRYNFRLLNDKINYKNTLKMAAAGPKKTKDHGAGRARDHECKMTVLETVCLIFMHEKVKALYWKWSIPEIFITCI